MPVLILAVYAVILFLKCGDCSPLHLEATPSTLRKVSHPLKCSSGGDTCPAGLFCSEGQCECKPLLNDVVTCHKNGNEVSLTVQSGFCVTSDGVGDEVSVGACSVPMTNKCPRYRIVLDYSILPGQLNNSCAITGRTGVLCGRCLPDHYPLAYAYNMTCIPCSHPHWNWLWYVMAAYLPLTLFYLFILFFNVKIMSAHVHVAILVCQTISSPPIIRHFDNFCSVRPQNVETFFPPAVFSLYGILNLDFFRPFYSNLCLGIGILPTLALDYAIAVYPLFLMVVSYLLITLHDRNYRVVTAMWSPFQRMFFFYRKNWNIKTSVIDSFATFFILSNVKLLSVSCDLLFPTTIHHFDGNNYTSSLGLLYAPDIEYFGKQHLPFGVLAIVVLFFVLILPAFLFILYPIRLFQKFLNLFSFRWYILHTFMDSFLGFYKNGTQPGTRDCRSFFVLYIVWSWFWLMIFGTTETTVAFVALALCASLVLATVLVVKPYKTPPHNSNTIVALYLLLGLFIPVSWIGIYSSCRVPSVWCQVFRISAVASLSIPLFDALHVVIMYLFKRRSDIVRPLVHCWRRCRNRLDGYEVLPGGSEALNEEEELVADRIENPKDYLPHIVVLQTEN